MQAGTPSLSPEALAARKRAGADQWDEMWEGVLYMPPAPNREHQSLESEIEAFLREHWARPRKAKVYHQINVTPPGGWPDDYRIPDLVLVTPERFSIDRNEYFEGAPEVVVEIHSPGDKAYEKLDFYGRLGVPEVWIIHRDSKAPELFVLGDGVYARQPADSEGWIQSAATKVELKAMAAETGAKLALRVAGQEPTRVEIPED